MPLLHFVTQGRAILCKSATPPTPKGESRRAKSSAGFPFLSLTRLAHHVNASTYQLINLPLQHGIICRITYSL